MNQTRDEEELRIECVNSLESISPFEWNELTQHNPFISYSFLRNLETSSCLEPHGWYPYHLLARKQGQLVAAIPTYARDNSYGEFVFDWSWADAYERAGGKYYPKLVTASPFSPVTGPRLLNNRAPEDLERAKNLIIQTADGICKRNGLSSWHTLFFES